MSALEGDEIKPTQLESIESFFFSEGVKWGGVGLYREVIAGIQFQLVQY